MTFRVSRQELELLTLKLLDYCKSNSWAGYDPYDALNSRLFAAVPRLNSRVPRIVFTQLLKRSLVNLRPILGIPKTQNPKGIALGISALIQLSRAGLGDHGDDIRSLVERLRDLRSPGAPYWCWGYSFPWQTRTIVVPAGAPNLVCTSFAANSLLDAYEYGGDPACVEMALSAAEYMLNELYWSGEENVAGFGYPLPEERAQVHNANLLASALLCRVAKLTGVAKFVDPALRVARYTATRQNTDGSWPYGQKETAHWIDNFHTGYNLCALRSIGDSLGTSEFQLSIEHGFRFYRRYFFREDGAPRYFHNRTYPIDVHCAAQSILTLIALHDLDSGNMPLAEKVLRWTIDHLWDEKGFFYYRSLRFCTIRIAYLRWSQAWMLLSMSTLLNSLSTPDMQAPKRETVMEAMC